jgi:outer membrane lipoprotein-sorting protein
MPRAAVLGLLGLAVSLGAAEKPKYTASEVFERMLAAQESRAWTRAELVKEEGPIGQAPVSVTRGLLQTKPGGLARLQIKKPSPGLIVCDGKRLFVELAEVQQVMQYDAAKLKASGNFFLDLASSIRHYAQAGYKRLFVPGKAFDAAKVTAIELLPKKPDAAGFERLKVWIDMERWVVLQVQLDYGGTRSKAVFSRIQAPSKDELAQGKVKDLDAALFGYKAPKGYEVFDLDL